MGAHACSQDVLTDDAKRFALLTERQSHHSAVSYCAHALRRTCSRRGRMPWKGRR